MFSYYLEIFNIYWIFIFLQGICILCLVISWSLWGLSSVFFISEKYSNKWRYIIYLITRRTKPQSSKYLDSRRGDITSYQSFNEFVKVVLRHGVYEQYHEKYLETLSRNMTSTSWDRMSINFHEGLFLISFCF